MLLLPRTKTFSASKFIVLIAFPFIADFLLVFYVFIGVLCCCSQEGNLTNYLLNTTRYSMRFRPVLHDNHTLKIRHSLILYRIVKVVSVPSKEKVLRAVWNRVSQNENRSDLDKSKQRSVSTSEISSPDWLFCQCSHEKRNETSNLLAGWTQMSTRVTRKRGLNQFD